MTDKVEWVIPDLPLKRVKKMLVDEFIYGLENRPSDFYIDQSHYRLVDSKTKQHWWIGNSCYGFQYLGVDWQKSPLVTGDRSRIWEFGWLHQRRAWKAFERWKKKPRKTDATYRFYAEGVMLLRSVNHPQKDGVSL